MSDQPSIKVVPHDLLESLAAQAPSPIAPPSRTAPASNNGDGQFTSRLLVEAWLRDKNVEFQVKGEPDRLGRVVYVLKNCPFNPDHGDPDSCIMQADDGRMSAKCFHNSCQGQGWQEFKHAIGAPKRHHYDPPLPRARRRRSTSNPSRNGKVKSPPPDTQTGDLPPDGSPPVSGVSAAMSEPKLPRIQMNKRQLRDVTSDAHDALVAHNRPPTIFQRGEVLTRVRLRDGENLMMEPLTDSALRGVLGRVADWFIARETEEGTVEEDDAPALEIVKDLATLPKWPGIPYLRGIVESPVFAPDGTLIVEPGYHLGARLWYQPAQGFVVDEIPSNPTPTQIATARDCLLIDLLGDFPFQDEASRAHAAAALFLPYVRPMIDGPTPLHLFDAPTEGTGKTLLASVIAIVGTGRDVEAIAEATDDEEWRKRITAVLIEVPTFVLVDNVSRILDSGALASVLTGRIWKDRILGVSKTACLPNNSVWMASGNNTRLSRELIRRTLFCRLDSHLDAPWERKLFRHPKLIAWTKANRGLLVWSALTLIQAWIAAGRPAGEQTMGMFESWVDVIGGILGVAGIPGLLANAPQFRAARADQVSEWRAFMAAWRQKHADKDVGVQELYALVTQENLLDSVLGDKGERSQRIRLGQALVKVVGRVFGEVRLESAGMDHKERQQFRLRQVPESDNPTPETRQWEA